MNSLSLVRSSSVQTGKCILYAEKSMPGRKKLAEELFFSLKRTVFLPYGQKNICPFVGKKSSPASFSMPGINLPAYRNIYSLRPPKEVFFRLVPQMKLFFLWGTKGKKVTQGVEDRVKKKFWFRKLFSTCEKIPQFLIFSKYQGGPS